MRSQIIRLDEVSKIRDTAVVIDVLRAFTTAAYAFDAGVMSIQLVRTAEEALAIRQIEPGTLVMGEVNGLRPPEFDFGNSPTALLGISLEGRSMVQRTSAGTQGALLSSGAHHILAASFVCASATARYLQDIVPLEITFVVTGSHTVDGGDEDLACAEYIQALINGENPAVEPYIERVTSSVSGRLFTGEPGQEYDRYDLHHAKQVDRFSFAMLAKMENNRMILRPYQV